MRRRFGNALQWYYVLVDQTNQHVRNSLDQARHVLLSDNALKASTPGEQASSSPPATPPPSSSPPPASSPPPSAAGQSSTQEPLTRPSDYLRRRCPLCFGGSTIRDPNMMCECYYFNICYLLT